MNYVVTSTDGSYTWLILHESYIIFYLTWYGDLGYPKSYVLVILYYKSDLDK